MNIIDISWPLSNKTTGYKDRTSVRLEQLKEFERDGARESALWITSHSGTHVDAPAHMLKEGKTIDRLSLENFSGPCVVLDMTMVAEKITREIVQEHADLIKDGDIVLCKTVNSYLESTAPFNPNFVYIESTGAEYLVEKKVKAVGIDYLGIERNQPDHGTHQELMSNGIVIIEGLRLAHVEPGRYMLVCLPLNVIGLDGAPARAVLLPE